MKQPRPTTIDFETDETLARPEYPPKPAGVAIKPWGGKARYYAWDHPNKNNCTKAQAVRALKEAYKTPDGILCQYGKFDVDVAETHLGLKRLPWGKYHDTLYLLFLDDPHAKELGLKPSAERLLGLPSEEQDAVGDWLMKHQPVPGVKVTRAPRGDHYFGRYIAYAPGDLVGRYAIGDVLRTEKLFKLLWAKTKKRGMLEAYDRERQLMPILLEIERQGVRVDEARLQTDIDKYDVVQDQLETWVRHQLKAKDLNIDSGAQLVKAMLKVDKVDETLLGLTKTGKYKSDKDTLKAAITDSQLAAVLRYRAQLKTCLGTFMKPWLQTAKRSKRSLIYTTWNQTRSTEGGRAVGARTGRLSSTPNFQNIPNVFTPIFRHEDRKDKTLPVAPHRKLLPPLPQVRSYIVPWHQGHVLVDRDYSQQELRILGHFEGGVLSEAYQEDPWLDVHERARTLINTMLNRNFTRKPIKNTGFGLIYGMGVGTLAEKSEVTVEVAKELKDAYLAIFPGLKAMYQDMRLRAKTDQPIRTWGGREYFCEPPRLIKGRIRTFDYKMVNVLIQGSAADCTKQALINYWAVKPKNHVFYLSVHDEILISVPRREIKRATKILKEAMEFVKFDIPILSEGSSSDENWASLEDYDKRGEICQQKR